MNSNGVLSELQFLDKYARYDYDLGRREKWDETVKRVVDFLVSYVPVEKQGDVYKLLFDAILNKRVSPSMRLMATAGKAAKLQESSIFNCGFLPLETTQDFHDLTLLLGLGVGVGFSVENHFVKSLGDVRYQNKDRTIKFVIPDDIYGWAQSIKFLIEHKMAGNRVNFDYSLIRPAGSPLKTRGGRACLTGDTIVYKDRKKPKEQNEVTLDYLFWLKNNSPENFSKIKIRSLDEETGVFYRNKLVDIIYNGVAPVYLVETENGYKIKATNNHRFMDDTGRYKFLSMFSVNERIAVNGKDFGCFCFDCGTTISRRSRRCKDCDRKSRLKIDALETTCGQRKEVRSYRNENNFCELCNSNLRLEVHHIDKNPRNNHVSNLQVLCSKCHHKIHLIDKLFGNPYKQKFVSYDRITSIKFVGYEKVYDLQMMSPNHNFVANGFVSHNSGPEPLMDAHIAIGRILDERAGKEIRSIDAFDIACHIAGAIVSGGVRRCLPSGSRVHTEHGMKKIEDVVLGDRVLTTDGYCSVTNKFNQGVQGLVRVVTQDSSFMCTPNHKIAVLIDQENYVWKRADELVFGDKLIAPYYLIEGKRQQLPKYTFERPVNSTNIVIPELDEDMAWLLGLIHGDGHIDFTNGEVSISVNGEELEVGVRAARQLRRFGVNVGLSEYENYFVLRVKSRQLANYFHNWLKQANVEIKIPEFIWNAPYEIKMAYVSGVMDADGSVKTRPVNVVTTVYESFARDIQLLLSSCGIQSRVKAFSTKGLGYGWQPKFGVNLINNKGKLEFIETPTLFKREIEIAGVEKRTNVFPDGVVWSDTNSPLIPVTFMKLENVEGEYQTWDLEVEDMHEFFCNGYLMHNSAMITIFDRGDDLMLGAKSGTWYEENLQRQYANISAVIDEELSKDEMSALIQQMHDSGFGEPGIFSRYAVRQTMPERRKAVFGMGTNPSL